MALFYSNGKPPKETAVSKITKLNKFILTNRSSLKTIDKDTTMKSRPLKNALYEFTQSHKTELNELKIQIKQITKENELLQMTIMENQESTQSLMKTIDNKTQEIKDYQKQQVQLKKDNELLSAKFDDLNNKLCALELLYDKNITELGKENMTQKRSIEQQKLVQIKITEEFNANRKDLQTKLAEKTAEYKAMQEQCLAAQVELKNSKEKVTILQNALETCKVQSANELKEKEQKVTQEYEAKMNNLKNELQQKDEIIMQHKQDKDELEKAKNKTIDELSYKIREIERVFGQPFNRVEPFTGQKTSPKTVPVQHNNQAATQPSTSNAIANFQRPTHTSNNVLAEIQTTAQSSTAVNNLRSQRKRNYTSASDNDASSDDDNFSTDWGWRPNPINLKNTEDSLGGGPYGFGHRKRSMGYVPETSESESLNQNTKRSRK